MTAWSHLPNAQLIDQLLTELAASPDQFGSAWRSAPKSCRDAGDTAWDRAWREPIIETSGRRRVWRAAWHAACATHNKSQNEMTYAINEAAGNAMLALVVYDDAGQYLSMTPDQLRFWAALTESPAATLLQPYVRARELIAQLHSQEITA